MDDAAADMGVSLKIFHLRFVPGSDPRSEIDANPAVCLQCGSGNCLGKLSNQNQLSSSQKLEVERNSTRRQTLDIDVPHLHMISDHAIGMG